MAEVGQEVMRFLMIQGCSKECSVRWRRGGRGKARAGGDGRSARNRKREERPLPLPGRAKKQGRVTATKQSPPGKGAMCAAMCAMGCKETRRAVKLRFDAHCTDFHGLRGVCGIKRDRDPQHGANSGSSLFSWLDGWTRWCGAIETAAYNCASRASLAEGAVVASRLVR